MILPSLTLNRQFVEDFMASTAPCFAMGVVEEGRSPCAFLALSPIDEIPPDVTYGGFNFGHSVMGTSQYEVVHFAFEFYGYRTFNTLVNPSDPVAKAVLEMMIERKEYFFFAINPSGAVTAFKADVGDHQLTGIVSNLDRIRKSTTSDEQYEAAVVAFSDNPHPVGPMLHWVCRADKEYLDLSGEIIELNPV
jgi:hypothetical protein